MIEELLKLGFIYRGKMLDQYELTINDVTFRYKPGMHQYGWEFDDSITHETIDLYNINTIDDVKNIIKYLSNEQTK